MGKNYITMVLIFILALYILFTFVDKVHELNSIDEFCNVEGWNGHLESEGVQYCYLSVEDGVALRPFTFIDEVPTWIVEPGVWSDLGVSDIRALKQNYTLREAGQ